jgi:hypothetical protein
MSCMSYMGREGSVGAWERGSVESEESNQLRE